MTEGNIWSHIILFALPLLVGSLFQQLYNTVDTWVLGRYVSDEAFSAVGSVGPIVNMLIGFFTGFSSGASVVISQYYGAKRYDQIDKAVRTASLITLVAGILLSALGIILTPTMLRIMKMPENVFAEAKTYLTIYFAGLIGLMIYNMGAGILRAIGDSQKPFYFLACTAVINIVLDLLFAIKFKMGVAGVAYATIIAQGISAILVVITLLTHKGCIRLRAPYLSIDFSILKKIVFIGIPAALQLFITAFSNVFVQSYINFFGDTVMGGWTAYTKIDQFMFMPMQAVALATTTFVGQNLGKKNVERAERGVTVSLLISLIVTATIMIPIMIFSPYMVKFFNENEEIIAYGSDFLKYITPFYLLCCINQVYAGALRGAGNSRTPMIIMLFSFVLFRQAYLFVMANFISNTVMNVAMAYPAGWLLCTIIYFIYYKSVGLSRGKMKLD
jgi:putative MATE family efflux protein